MSMERMAMHDYGDCPLCLSQVFPGAQEEEIGILACPKCRSMLVVQGRQGHRLILDEAPRIGEEWGE